MAVAANAALALGVRSSSAASFIDFATFDLSDISKIVVPNSKTLQYKVRSPCCFLCFTHYVVSHYQPVVFIEVIKGEDDGVFDEGGKLTDGVVTSDGKWHHSFDVRVWDLPQIAIDAAYLFQSCRLCGKKGVKKRYFTDVFGTSAAKIAELATTSCVPSENEVAKQVKALIMQFMDQLPFSECIPKLLYDSSIDPHWRTGCRDVEIADMMGGFCELPDPTGFTQKAASLASKLNLCVGSWGNVLPRQHRVVQHDIQTAAAMAAYRAMHLAAYSFNTFPYEISLKGKLQQTIPEAGQGYPPGTNKEIFNASRKTPKDGHWGFVWWVPATCCKDIRQIVGICPPIQPCIPL